VKIHSAYFIYVNIRLVLLEFFGFNLGLKHVSIIKTNEHLSKIDLQQSATIEQFISFLTLDEVIQTSVENDLREIICHKIYPYNLFSYGSLRSSKNLF